MAACEPDRGPAVRPAPKLRAALQVAKKARHAFVVIDGTLIPVDRVATDRPCCSGKHKRHHHLVVRAICDSTHGLTAARIWGILRELAASGLIILADKGYHGAR